MFREAFLHLPEGRKPCGVDVLRAQRERKSANHHALPDRRAFLVFFFVTEERRGLVAELIDEDLQLQHGAFFRTAVFVVDVCL